MCYFANHLGNQGRANKRVRERERVPPKREFKDY
jgi:hypothetical protein